MPGPIPVIRLNAKDVDGSDPTYSVLNQILVNCQTAINELFGLNGQPINLQGPINSGGKLISNVGAAKAATDALTQAVADTLYVRK